MITEQQSVMKWTRFVDFAAQSRREMIQSWEQLAAHIKDAGPFPSKSTCPWLKLAVFGEHRSAGGSLRNNANVVEVTGIEGDYDGEVMRPEEAISVLERHQIRALVYTSPSHTIAAPRWRVLAPLSCNRSPSARASLLARLNGALGGVLTPESFALSQSYFYGRVQGMDEYLVLHTFDDANEGSCIDELDQLDDIAVIRLATNDEPKKAQTDFAARVQALGRKLRTGDGRRELLSSYINKRSNDGLTADELAVLVGDICERYFDPADPTDSSNLSALISHATARDAAQRAQVESVIGGFVEQVSQQPPPQQLFKLKPSDVSFASLKPTKWVLGGFVAAGEIVCWAGQPGVGKSTAIAGISMVVAGFADVIGSNVPNDRPRTVVIVSEHAGQYERQFFGFCKKYQIDPEQLAKHIFLFDATRLRPSEISREINRLVEYGDGEPPLIVLDTASATFEVSDENDNAAVGALLAVLKPVVMYSGAPLWIMAHAAKALGREDSEITPRGASAFIGDVHGTGSVFRDKNFPKSTFMRSLKNRSEREYSEIEIITDVEWHDVIDERGVNQSVGVRLGIPMISSDDKRSEMARAGKDAEQFGAEMAKSLALGDSITAAITATAFATRSTVCQMVGGRKQTVLDHIAQMLAAGTLIEIPMPGTVKTNNNKRFYLCVSSVPVAGSQSSRF